MTLEEIMSFKHECKYLSGLLIDYKKKLKDQQDEIVYNNLCLIEYIYDRIIDESESSRQKL